MFANCIGEHIPLGTDATNMRLMRQLCHATKKMALKFDWLFLGVKSIICQIWSILRREKIQSDDGNVLIICHHESDLPRLEKFAEMRFGKVRVASDDINVRQAASSKEWIDEVTYIERMETFDTVAQDVIGFVDNINDWLDSLSKNVGRVPDEQLHWRGSPEGGRTQSIQDALLLIRTFDSLLSQKVDRLIVLRRRETMWEDDLLIRTAKERGVEVSEKAPVSVLIENRLSIVLEEVGVRGATVTVPIPNWFRLQFHKAALILRIVHAHLAGFNPPQTDGQEITFQLASSSRKHVDNIVGPMQSFDDIDDYIGVALCWNAHSGVKLLRKKGLEAVELENWVSLRGLVRAYRDSRAIRRLGLYWKDHLEDSDEMVYHGVNITPSIWPELRDFLHHRIFERIIMGHALDQYLDERHPVAIKVWSGGTHGYGRVTMVRARNKTNSDTVLFGYPIGTYAKSPYFPAYMDLYITTGEIGKQNLVEQGVDASDVMVARQSRFDSLFDFKDQHMRDDSESELGISNDRTLSIFYAPQNEMRGFYWRQEHFRVTRALVEFVEKYPEMTLIIKPHPSSKSNIVKTVTAEYSLDNVIVVDQSESPYHCINASDVVITKYSTVGFEAMLFEKVLVSIALDGLTRYQDIYGDVPDKFQNTEQMISFLTNVIDDYEAVARKQESRRDQFLQSKFELKSQSSSSIAAALISYIKRERRS